MASGYLLSFMAVVFIIGDCYGFPLLDRLKGDTDSCEDLCLNTYSLHTYEKASHLNTCRRGCRLFSIIDFVHEDSDLNATREACAAACTEAYEVKEEAQSCEVGCGGQMETTKVTRKQAEDSPAVIHSVFPLLYVHGLYSNMRDKVWHGWTVRWSYYMQGNQGSMVILRSEPQIYTEFGRGPEGQEYKTVNYLETNLEPVDNSATPNLKSSQMRSIDLSKDGFLDGNFDDEGSSDWLGCISKKTGLPRLFLTLTVLLSVMVMIWLCLTSAATAPEQRIKMQKLSIPGDFDYVKEVSEKGLMYVQPQDRYEADPLPIKIKVQRI
ncbi:transmembrane protein 59 [Lingula anatina]|uniref:Transmembrane protein 59 n=1 Tax=Lingula anatina TaxID=7574 RepID=A0A1S3J404_LINAN|nr:transmembrane protein 59 [Lingula anatina]|eukprot:XP_013404996.1 transmembrane protein 59 [Lingula anatina]